jgi:hypothetical protein
LNGSEIKDKGAGILARETESRHIRMARHETLAQSINERVEIHSPIEGAKGRSADMRALTTRADRVTLRAHGLGKGAAAFL